MKRPAQHHDGNPQPRSEGGWRMTSWTRRGVLRVARWTLHFLLRFPGQVAVAAFTLPWVLLASSSPSHSLWASGIELYVLAVVACALMCAVAEQGVRTRAWTAVTVTYVAIVNFIAADFAYLYWSLSGAAPASFSEPLTKAGASYFAWATMTTTGFGDVVPHSETARLATTVQMALTFLLVSFGLALLAGAAPHSRTDTKQAAATGVSPARAMLPPTCECDGRSESDRAQQDCGRQWPDRG